VTRIAGPPELSRRDLLRATALAVITPALFGCATDATTTHVLAAASLEAVLRAALDHLEQERPGMDAQLDAASSTMLATQVAEGRAVDLLATADARSMARAADSGRLAAPTLVARNKVVLVTNPQAEHRITETADLKDDEVVVSLCDASIPCGRLADDLLGHLGLRATAERAAREVDVRAVVARLLAGEADAGVVYASDLFRIGASLVEVRVDPVPVLAAEVLVALAHDASADARSLDTLLRGDDGRALLRDFGFEPA
jgi:molybdate transport system substrate-binding protein